jgi:hypothetical protein
MATPVSEYGGRDGLIQSSADGHVPTASERLMLLYATAADTATSGEDITGLIGSA